MLSGRLFPYLFILILCISCRGSKIMLPIKSSDGSWYSIKSGRFSNIDYVIASNRKDRRSANVYTIDFDHRFLIRKSVYDAKGNYKATFHAVTDTTGTLKFFDIEFMPEIQAVRLKKGITPIDSYDSFLLNAINAHLVKNKYKHTMPEGIGKKIIGWVASE